MSNLYMKYAANKHQHNSLGGSPYQGNGRTINKQSLQRSYDIGLAIKIPKKIPNVRMSMVEDANKSVIEGIGMVTQSSLYGGSSIYGEKLGQSKTTVRIRGKHNNVIQTSGSLIRTLEEEKRMEEKRRQMKRSNERLRMLEGMEMQRQ